MSEGWAARDQSSKRSPSSIQARDGLVRCIAVDGMRASIKVGMLRQSLAEAGRIVQEMGLLDKLRSTFSGPRLIDELVILAGQSEALVNRLRRHAERLTYPAIAQDIRDITEKEAAHERTLRGILSAQHLWPRPPEEVPHEGSNNWERLSNDLEILLLWARQLHQHAMRWEGEHPELAETLMKIANEASDNEYELRRQVAKLDPQALD